MEVQWRKEPKIIKWACPRCKGHGYDPEDGNPMDGPYECRDCHGNGERCDRAHCWMHD